MLCKLTFSSKRRHEKMDYISTRSNRERLISGDYPSPEKDTFKNVSGSVILCPRNTDIPIKYMGNVQPNHKNFGELFTKYCNSDSIEFNFVRCVHEFKTDQKSIKIFFVCFDSTDIVNFGQAYAWISKIAHCRPLNLHELLTTIDKGVDFSKEKFVLAAGSYWPGWRADGKPRSWLPAWNEEEKKLTSFVCDGAKLGLYHPFTFAITNAYNN